MKLHKEKHTIREISERVKRFKSVVGRVVKSYNNTGKIVSAFKTSRPRKTSAREDRIMQRMSLKDRFKSCTEIKRVMNSSSCVNVSRQTVSRRLQEIGLFNRTPRKKPLVSSKNKKRLEFANSYVIWTYENWAKVFFSDECKFNLFGYLFGRYCIIRIICTKLHGVKYSFLIQIILWRCPWCNGYRRRKWRHEFKSWTRLIAFHIALIPLGNVWIQSFSLQLWVNSRAD